MVQDDALPDQSPQYEWLEGESNITIDGKGRFGMPNRYRKALAELCEGKVVITLALTPITALDPRKEPFRKYLGLSIYPFPAWLAFKSDLKSRDRYDPMRAAMSVFIASALGCEIDSQGRILVPTALRGFLNRNAAPDGGEENSDSAKEDPSRLKLVGLSDRFELWRESVWESVQLEMLAASAYSVEAARNAPRKRKRKRSDSPAQNPDRPS